MPTHSLDYDAPILKHLLHSYENLALVMYSTSGYDIYMFKVMRHQLVDIKVVEEFSGNELASGESTDFIRLTKDSVGGDEEDDYFYGLLKNSNYYILHAAIGVGPEDMLDTRVVYRYANKENKIFWPEYGFNLGIKPDYIDPRISPFSEPKVAAEFFMWNKINILFKIYNYNTETIRPAIRILGAVYEVVPITSRETVMKALSGRIPCRFEPVFGVISTKPTPVPTEWGVPVTLSREEIAGVI